MSDRVKFQAMVYDILPSTTAVFGYATGSRKLSANEQFFVGSQTVVSLLQTTQIGGGCRKAMLGVCDRILWIWLMIDMVCWVWSKRWCDNFVILYISLNASISLYSAKCTLYSMCLKGFRGAFGPLLFSEVLSGHVDIVVELVLLITPDLDQIWPFCCPCPFLFFFF